MKVRVALSKIVPRYIDESNVARCRDGEVRIQHALKLANVDLGCSDVMASPSLFLHFFRQLVFLCH